MSEWQPELKERYFWGKHGEAKKCIEADPNLSPTEAMLLIDCVYMRQQERDFRKYTADKVRLAKQEAENIEAGFIDYCNNSWMPNAIWFRFTAGDMFATQRDQQARSHRDAHINKKAAERAKETREHHEAVEAEERRMREALAGSSPYAKRAFNTIAISGATLRHFPPAEIASAAHLPNPLEKIFTSAPV